VIAAGPTLLRRAAAADNVQIAAIWNLEVAGGLSTTETRPRSFAAQRAWLARHGDDYPVVVAVDRDEVLGFGALAPYRRSPAFRHTVEDSVYVRTDQRGRGRGGLLLERLVVLARERGHHSVFARVTAVNTASLRLHEGHGFARVGLEREVAWKLGRWLDVVVLQRLLP
jgi:phosphinothricin acetyltransferase